MNYEYIYIIMFCMNHIILWDEVILYTYGTSSMSM